LAGLQVTASPRGSAYLGLRVSPEMVLERAPAPMREGDVLLGIDGTPLANLDALRSMIPMLEAGQLLQLQLRGVDGLERTETWTTKERDRDVFRVSTGGANQLWRDLLAGLPGKP